MNAEKLKVLRDAIERFRNQVQRNPLNEPFNGCSLVIAKIGDLSKSLGFEKPIIRKIELDVEAYEIAYPPPKHETQEFPLFVSDGPAAAHVDAINHCDDWLDFIDDTVGGDSSHVTADEPDKSDTKSDKPKIIRPLSDDGKKCAQHIKRLRKTGDFTTKEQAIKSWISSQRDPDAISYLSIDRELSDNPGYWK